jgi:copper(I)-binding protein
MKMAYLVLLAVLLGACGPAPGEAVQIEDLRIRPPLPGSEAAVAYFRVVNHGRDAIDIKGVSSQSFGAAEIHQSLLENGISRMRPVPVLRVPGRGSVDFKPGSYHVMLFRPVAGLAPGQPVSISLEYGDNGDVTASVAYGDGF